MKKSHDTIATRLAQILIKLNSGERFTTNELSEEFNVDIRTIQRDLKKRLSYLPIKKENGYYSLETYALGKLTYEDIKNFATISSIKELYPDLTNGFISDILNSKVNSAFIVKNSGFEKLGDKTKEFEDISAAILNNKQLTLIYSDKKRVVDPYKLANVNGIWYIVADEDKKLKNYTFSILINKIKTILKTINLQDFNTVSFSEKLRDIAIDDKGRQEFGKGYRALLYSVFIIALAKLLQEKSFQIGVTIFDSPMVTYKPSANYTDDDTISVDLAENLYNYIADNFYDSQVIIIENTTPPKNEKINSIEFTKNEDIGRYGFIPLSK